MIDLTAERPIPLAEAAEIVPPARSGKRTHFTTLLRWVLKGAKAPDEAMVNPILQARQHEAQHGQQGSLF